MRLCLIMTAIGFFSGAILYSYILPKLLLRRDVCVLSEDGNPGSSNVIRFAGLPLGILCMALDVLKAFVPVFVSVQVLGLRGISLIPVTVAPIAGHAFSPLRRFKGGKAVSTTFGALLGLILLTRVVLVLALTLAFFRFIVVIRPDSAGVVTSLAAASTAAVIFEPSLWLKTVVILISVLVTVKQLQHPDKGPYSVGIWHYSLSLEDKRLKFSKT